MIEPGALRHPQAKRSGLRSGRTNPKIDMTPMADLGFLLISFFIFTTEISKPAVTNLYMTHPGEPTKIPGSRSLTILLTENDRVYYYFGEPLEAISKRLVHQTFCNEEEGIGKIIRQKQADLTKSGFSRADLIVIIKPGKGSSYKNVVSALDEMLINGVTKYIVDDQQKVEERYVRDSFNNR